MAWTEGATWPISIYLIVIAAVTFIATRVAPETASKALN
jgi:MFS transporter, MHS family, shikimate and dehydroshikimate transport protein